MVMASVLNHVPLFAIRGGCRERTSPPVRPKKGGRKRKEKEGGDGGKKRRVRLYLVIIQDGIYSNYTLDVFTEKKSIAITTILPAEFGAGHKCSCND